MAGKTFKPTLSVNVFFWLLPLMMVLSFAVLSCGDDDESGSLVGIVYDEAGKGDKSFNDSAYEGIKRAQEELGAVVSEETTDGTESHREELIRSLAADNDLVIAVGFFIREFDKKGRRGVSQTPISPA